MLSSAHTFLLDQLGDQVASLKTTERTADRLVLEVVTSDRSEYLVAVGPLAQMRIEVDALLEAERRGMPFPQLRGYEFDEAASRGVTLTRRLCGRRLADLDPPASGGAVAARVAETLVAMHERCVEGWGPLDEAATVERRAPVGSFTTWRAATTYGVGDALRRIESQGVLQPDVVGELSDAVAMAPDEPAIEPRWLYGSLSPANIVVNGVEGSVGFACVSATACGDPARDLATWMLASPIWPVGPLVDAYNAAAPEPVDLWRIWWWAIIEAVRGLDRSLLNGALASQLEFPMRIRRFLDETGLAGLPPLAPPS